MTLEQRPDDRFIHRQHPDVVNADGPARFLRAAGEKRRRGVDADGMPMASEVVVRSLDGTVLRTEAPQTAVASRPLGLHVVPLPPITDPDPEPEIEPPSYSFAVAFRFAQVQADLPKNVASGDGGFTLEVFARQTGINFETVAGWRARGSIPRDAADGVAVALGLHPVMLWPEWLTDGLAEADRFDADRLARKRDKERRRLKGWDAIEPETIDWLREMRLRRRRINDKKRLTEDEMERRRQYAAANYAANKERRLAWQREYHRNNRERELARSSAYGKANREKLNAQQRERYRNAG